MKRAVGIGLAFSLAACGSSEKSLDREAQQQQFTEVVEAAAYSGGEYELDEQIPCDFTLLIGELAIRRTLGDESDYAAAVVEDEAGKVPEFGLVQCFDRDGERLIRGNDGY